MKVGNCWTDILKYGGKVGAYFNPSFHQMMFWVFFVHNGKRI